MGYEPKTWVFGEVIEAEYLNNIEKGIENLYKIEESTLTGMSSANNISGVYYTYNEGGDLSTRLVTQTDQLRNEVASTVNGVYMAVKKDEEYISIVLEEGYGGVVSDTLNERGLVYGADYSENYIDRSLVDKAYIDSKTPIGSDSDIRTWDEEGKPVAKPIGIKQLTDIASFPPFANGVFTATSMNSTNKTGLLSFIEFSQTPKAGAFPVYSTGGVMKVSNGVANNDAVSMEQYNALLARIEALEP